MCANANLFCYVESTAVGLRMEPAAAKGFPQDGIVRFLQTLEECGVSISVDKSGSGPQCYQEVSYLGLLVKTRQVPS